MKKDGIYEFMVFMKKDGIFKIYQRAALSLPNFQNVLSQFYIIQISLNFFTVVKHIKHISQNISTSVYVKLYLQSYIQVPLALYFAQCVVFPRRWRL